MGLGLRVGLGLGLGLGLGFACAAAARGRTAKAVSKGGTTPPRSTLDQTTGITATTGGLAGATAACSAARPTWVGLGLG